MITVHCAHRYRDTKLVILRISCECCNRGRITTVTAHFNRTKFSTEHPMHAEDILAAAEAVWATQALEEALEEI